MKNKGNNIQNNNNPNRKIKSYTAFLNINKDKNNNEEMSNTNENLYINIDSKNIFIPTKDNELELANSRIENNEKEYHRVWLLCSRSDLIL